MSMTSLRSKIASKTTFDALDVDSGEDTDEEQVSEQDSHSAQDRFVIDTYCPNTNVPG